jgi:hypothetical protein
LEINCPDRIYLTLSVPNLMVGGQVVSFLTQHEKAPIPSPAMLERRGQAFRRAVASYAQAHDIPLISFAGEEGQTPPRCAGRDTWPERKIDQVMPLMRKAAATGRSQVVAIGIAQEYQRVFTATTSEARTSAVWFSYHRPNAECPATTSPSGTPRSGRRLSKSAPTSPTQANSGSTDTSSPNAKRPRPASGVS